MRDGHVDALNRLDSLARKRPLTADESADLGALLVRFGQPDKAVAALRPAAAAAPDHFRLHANLGTAWQLAGDLRQAAAALEDAVRLAPPDLRDAERLHLRLVRLRLAEGRAAATADAVDDLFGVRYVGDDGKPRPGGVAAAERAKLPADAAALVQRLALWLPADGRLLWQVGEVANALGDVRTAAAVLDGCVTEFGMGAPDLRRRRLLYRAAADALAKDPAADKHAVAFRPKSPRALRSTFDPAALPPVRADAVNPLPWPLLAETTLPPGVFRPRFLPHLDKLDGKRVSLAGFVSPLTDDPEPGEFLLTEFPVGCWFCEAPDPTGAVRVVLADGRRATLGKGLVKVEGVFALNRGDPEGFLFTVTDARLGGAD